MLILERFYRDQVPGAPILFVEGMLSALLGSVGALYLLPDQVGLVSIFLCAIASLPGVQRQLDWNRQAIVQEGRPVAKVNGIFTLRLLSLFAGQFIAFSALAVWLSPAALQLAFSYQLGTYVTMTFPMLAFPPPSEVFAHNLGVLALFFVLAVLFRHGGALLAVAWNASVWGVVFGWLARQWTLDGGPVPIEAYARVMAGVAPHMALEAVGYILGAFAGVFLSQGLARYDARSNLWEGLLRTLTFMMLLAVAAVACGAVLEGAVAPSLVRALTPSG